MKMDGFHCRAPSYIHYSIYVLEPLEHDPADSSACSGLRARLRLEQRLLRSKDGSGLWSGPNSAQIISVQVQRNIHERS